MAFILGFLFCGSCRGQNAELGVLSSPIHAGLTSRFTLKSGTPSMLRLYMDLYGVLDGSHSLGCKADYHVLFPFCEKQLKGGSSLEISAGPGAMVGYAYDIKEPQGLVAGLSAALSADFRFKAPVVVSLGFSGVLGCHILHYRNGGGTLKIYRNGICEAWIPEIGIKYRF